MKVGDTVHIDTDSEEWGRVASDGTVMEIFERDALINAASIRANLLVPLSDIFETGGGGPGEADAALRDMGLGRIAAKLRRGNGQPPAGSAPPERLPDGTRVRVRSEQFEGECEGVITGGEYDGGWLYRLRVTAGRAPDVCRNKEGEVWVYAAEVQPLT